MKLSNLFDDEPSEKTAGAAPTAPVTQRQQAPRESVLSTAIHSAQVAADERQKVASQGGSAEGDLETLARGVAAQNRDALLKEAADVGRAIADAFMSQVAVYEKVARDLGAQGPSEAEKVAAYREASERFTREVHEISADHYLGGYHDVQQLLQESR